MHLINLSMFLISRRTSSSLKEKNRLGGRIWIHSSQFIKTPITIWWLNVTLFISALPSQKEIWVRKNNLLSISEIVFFLLCYESKVSPASGLFFCLVLADADVFEQRMQTNLLLYLWKTKRKPWHIFWRRTDRQQSRFINDRFGK